MRGKIVTYRARVPKAENGATVCPRRTLRKIPDSSARHKTSKDDTGAISVTASEEDLNEFLLNRSEPGATTDSQTEVNDELLTELSAGLTDDEKKGPQNTKQLADIVNK